MGVGAHGAPASPAKAWGTGRAMKRGNPSKGAGKVGAWHRARPRKVPRGGSISPDAQTAGPQGPWGRLLPPKTCGVQGRSTDAPTAAALSAPHTTAGGRPSPRGKLRSEEELARGRTAGGSSAGTGTFWGLFFQTWAAPKAGCRGV